MARDGTFIIRPDSGKASDVLCGTGDKIPKFKTIKEARESLADTLREECNALCDEEAGNAGFSESNDLFEVDGLYFSVKSLIETYGEWQDRGPKRYSVDTVDVGEAFTYTLSSEQKGLVQILAEKFGTTSNGTVKSLDSHISWIYGDSITVQVQWEIYTRLMAKGLSPVGVLGVGSYSYQYVTRDTHGSAVKCTAAFREDGSVIDVCKSPKTDPKKKSAKGLLYQSLEDMHDGTSMITQIDQVSAEMEQLVVGSGAYINYMVDGIVVSEETLTGTRALVAEQLEKLV
jgi:hypothetical protein